MNVKQQFANPSQNELALQKMIQQMDKYNELFNKLNKKVEDLSFSNINQSKTERQHNNSFGQTFSSKQKQNFTQFQNKQQCSKQKIIAKPSSSVIQQRKNEYSKQVENQNFHQRILTLEQNNKELVNKMNDMEQEIQRQNNNLKDQLQIQSEFFDKFRNDIISQLSKLDDKTKLQNDIEKIFEQHQGCVKISQQLQQQFNDFKENMNQKLKENFESLDKAQKNQQQPLNRSSYQLNQTINQKKNQQQQSPNSQAQVLRQNLVSNHNNFKRQQFDQIKENEIQFSQNDIIKQHKTSPSRNEINNSNDIPSKSEYMDINKITERLRRQRLYPNRVLKQNFDFDQNNLENQFFKNYFFQENKSKNEEQREISKQLDFNRIQDNEIKASTIKKYQSIRKENSEVLSKNIKSTQKELILNDKNFQN